MPQRSDEVEVIVAILARNQRTRAVSDRMTSRSIALVLVVACRSPKPAPVSTPPATAEVPVDAPPGVDAVSPPCTAGVHSFECDVIEGDLIHPEGIID